MRGELLPSVTFGECAGLTSAAHFLVDNVELWGVGEPSEPYGRRRSSWEVGADSSVREDNENRLMLEFVGMERSVAYDARLRQ